MILFQQTHIFIFLLVLLMIFKNVHTLHNGLLHTPPMGWLSWEMFGCNTRCTYTENETCISENLFLQIAAALKDKGFLDAGYDRINIDDCWMATSRDIKTGDLLPDPIRFANGMNELVRKIHDFGFKAGIYQNYGQKTCMGYPGLFGYTKKDAQKFAQWDFDMVKLDSCFTPTSKLDQGVYEFSRELLKTGKKIALTCSLAYYQLFVSRKLLVPHWKLISSNCNTFRVFHDIHASWESILKTIDFMSDNQIIFRSVTGPGSWPDPDMLMIGKAGISSEEAETQMAIWCILPAPLFMSNDPRAIKQTFLDILLNKDAIKINQDFLGLPGERVFHNRSLDIWRRKLENDQMAIVVLNREEYEIHVHIPFIELAIDTLKNIEKLEILDIFKGNKLMLKEDFLDSRIQSHGVVFWKISAA